MRWITLLCLAWFGSAVQAQDQEHSLIDRLLRPNTELRNPQQGKVFRADSEIITHTGSAKSFISDKTPEKRTFADTRTLGARQYPSRSDRVDAQQHAFDTARQVKLPAHATAPSVTDLHSAYHSHLEVSGRSFGNQRAFREQGKSQKSLSRINPPLTIDQVRELLNKNK